MFRGRLSRKNFILGIVLVFGTFSVIGIVAAIILASLSGAQLKSRDAELQMQEQQVQVNQTIQQTNATSSAGVIQP